MKTRLLYLFSKVLRYQRGDQKSYIKEGQTLEWPIENRQKEYMCHRWQRISFVCRNHNPVLFYFFMKNYRIVTKVAQRVALVKQMLLTFPEYEFTHGFCGCRNALKKIYIKIIFIEMRWLFTLDVLK
jgi:hypothetical protein